MKQTNIFIATILLLLLAFGASAQIDIKAADGADLSGSTYCGDTFTVQVVNDGTPVGAGTNVVFVLANIGGDPIYVTTDSDGKAKYKPLVNGILTVRVLDGTTVVAETEITVEDEPWVPEPTPTSKPYSGGSGGGGGMLPTPAPTATPTIVTTPVKTPTVVETTVEESVTEIPKPTQSSPKPRATPEQSSVPGFGAVFAIVGVLGCACIYFRRMRQRE